MCTNKEIRTEIVLNLRKMSEEDILISGVLAKDENLVNKTCSDIADWIVFSFERNAVDDARFVVHTNGIIDVYFVLAFTQKAHLRFLLKRRIKRLINKAEFALNKHYGYLITKTMCKVRK